MDSAYLEANVADALVAGLSSTVEEQPGDAVAFLGSFLLKYVQTQKLNASVAADDAQAEVDAKEAASKRSAEKAAAKPAQQAAAAKEAANDKLESRLEKAATIGEEDWAAVVSHLQAETNATGVYVAVKEAGAGGDDEEEEPSATVRYIAATTDHSDLMDKTLQQPTGAIWPVWELPKKDEEEEEEEEDEDGEPKAKPPPPELQPLHIPNILRSQTAHFHRIPRLGAFLAVPFEYDNLTHADAIPPPEEKEEEEEKGEEEGDEEGEKKVEEAPSGEPPIPAGRVKKMQAAICLDTMGQIRPFTAAEIASVKAWAARLVPALNRSEQNQYEVNYKQHQIDLAAEAAAAAEEAAKGAEEGEAE